MKREISIKIFIETDDVGPGALKRLGKKLREALEPISDEVSFYDLTNYSMHVF